MVMGYLKTPKQHCFILLDLPSWASNVISLEVAGALLKLQLGGFTSQENIPMLLEI